MEKLYCVFLSALLLMSLMTACKSDDKKAFWFLEDSFLQYGEYTKKEFSLSRIDTVSKEYKENKYTVTADVISVYPMSKDKFLIMERYGENKNDTHSAGKWCFYFGDINNSELNKVDIFSQMPDVNSGKVCTDENEEIYGDNVKNGKLYVTSTIKDDNRFIVSIKSIDLNGKVEVVGQPFIIPVKNGDTELSADPVYKLNDTFYVTLGNDKNYNKFLLCVDNNNVSSIKETDGEWFFLTENYIVVENNEIQVNDNYQNQFDFHADYGITIKYPYNNKKIPDREKEIYGLDAKNNGVLFMRYDDNNKEHYFYASKEQIRNFVKGNAKELFE